MIILQRGRGGGGVGIINDSTPEEGIGIINDNTPDGGGGGGVG